MGIFDGVLGSVAGGLVSGVGSFLGAQQQNANNAQAQLSQYFYNNGLMDKANTQNVQNATTAFNRSQEQLSQIEQYNTQMSNTAYQRSVADMKAAGLNPILGVSSGGAATPPVSTAPPASPTSSASGVGLPSMQSALGSGIASAMQGARLFSAVQQAQADVDNAKSQNKVIESTADKVAADARTANITASKQSAYMDSQINAANQAAAASGGAAYNSQAQGDLAGANIRKVNQDRENTGSGGTAEATVGLPGVGGVKISGPAGSIGKYIGAIKENVSPRVPVYQGPPSWTGSLY